MESIMLFYLVLYMILGLVIYHSIFEIWYFNFGKALLGEIFGAFIFGALMTALTLKYWYVGIIIIILIGLVLAGKIQNPNGKKFVVGLFATVALITAFTGIKYNRQEKEKQVESENNYESDSDYKNTHDSSTYLSDSSDDSNTSENYDSVNEGEYENTTEEMSNDSDLDYIIPYSDRQNITESDVEYLSIQEINYAKNEIYARHGRIFKSKELNTYFNSKSWYYGTIEPDDFSDDMLSKVEKDNVKFLSEIEFSIDPNGYQLDQ